MTAAVLAQGLTKTFPGGRGIRGVDLDVEEGQVFGFLGPNGAGKSTTIHCLLGLYRSDAGTARVLGRDPAGSDGRARAEVGYLPGELRLPGTLTGGDLVARFARLRRLADTTYLDSLVRRFSAQLDHPLRTLSTGNKQKVGLLLAFMHRPRLLLLDEPTSGLDPLLQDEFAALVRETADEGRTVLLSSHDLDEVQRVAHRVAIIRGGRIVVDDTVEALRAAAGRTVEVSFDHDVDPGALSRIPSVTVRASDRRRLHLTCTGPVAPLLSALAAMGPTDLTARPADLGELFLGLYGGPGAAPEHEERDVHVA